MDSVVFRGRKMLEHEYILAQFERDYKGTYLCFGDWLLPVSRELLKAGWKGVHVVESADELTAAGFGKGPEDGDTTIIAQVTEDPRIIQLMDGYWRRSLTVTEIFTQFPGPYDFIGMVNTDKDRHLWKQESIFSALPKVYMLGEDGHNEEVVKIGRDRGYIPSIVNDAVLALVHAE